MTRVLEPHVVLRLGQARVALPVAVVAHMTDVKREACLDLAALLELPDMSTGETQLVLRSEIGPIAVGVSAVEDMLNDFELQPAPPLTSLQQPALLRGFVLRGVQCIVVLDGPELAALAAHRVAMETHESP